MTILLVRLEGEFPAAGLGKMGTLEKDFIIGYRGQSRWGALAFYGSLREAYFIELPVFLSVWTHWGAPPLSHCMCQAGWQRCWPALCCRRMHLPELEGPMAFEL